ncbi:MAG TPA: winged helix DNA-binding domain-containing protein [Solirubrobacterales bacterium]|nr:winged helix DNA-binding domain-containing protein [Solirubrobacterales bacterium]
MKAREVHSLRLTAQGLATRPGRDPVAVAERLLAIQGQDPRGARLAVRARSEGVVASDVGRALGERKLLVTWVNRGTLHLIRAEDYPLLQALTTPPLWTSCRTRLRQTGVGEAAAERGVETVARALADEGPLTRAQLRERLDSADVPTAGQALIHLLFYASLHGVCVRGPMVGKEHAFVLVRDWLGPPEPPRTGAGRTPERTSSQFVSEGVHPAPDRDAALAELARRYLVGHGPATDADLARWAGLPLRDARAGLKSISRRIVDLGDGLLDLRKREETAPLPPPCLLGAFDPLLLGWASREAVVGEHQQLVTTNGIFRPFALVDGRAVSTWRLPRGQVEIEHLERVTKKAAGRLEADAAAVEAFLSN